MFGRWAEGGNPDFVTGFDCVRAVGEMPGPAQQGEVNIEVDVVPTQVATVRVVAADLAARADFDLDTVSDLKMAVDEACSTLVTLARPGSRLRCTLRVDPDRITVTARISKAEPTTISQDTFGWRVLVTLADEVEVLTGNESGTSSLGIRLVTMRPGATT